MIKLSININKLATLRNARGGNNPDLIKSTQDCERFGAQGITIHPRPDERHIRYDDVYALKEVVTTEYNIEGNPKQGRYLDIVKEVKPTQATLVPDAENAITSNSGWDTIKHQEYLVSVINDLKSLGIRTSIFIDPIPEMIENAAKTGTDRIELYTEGYAQEYLKDPQKAISKYREVALIASDLGLGINAGHDLDLENLNYFYKYIPNLLEVSIGHAVICDAIYLGLENTIRAYRRKLEG